MNDKELKELTKDELEALKATVGQKKRDCIPLKVDELAVYFDCSIRHVERLYKKLDDPNKLKVTKVGGLVRFTWDNIDAFQKAWAQNSLLSLGQYDDDDLDELDPAAGLEVKPNYP